MAVPQFLEPFTSIARTAIAEANSSNIKSLPSKVNPPLRTVLEYIEPQPLIFEKVDSFCAAVIRASATGSVEDAKASLFNALADLEECLGMAQPNDTARILRLV